MKKNDIPQSSLLVTIKKLRQIERATANCIAYLCGVLFFLYSIYVFLEVIGRNFFGIYTGISDEIGGYTLAIGGSLALAYTLISKGHVRIDIIFDYIPKPLKPWLDIIGMGTMAAFAWIVTDHLLTMTMTSYKLKATGHSLIEMPQWIIQAIVTLGYLFLLVTAITSLIICLIKAITSYDLDAQ